VAQSPDEETDPRDASADQPAGDTERRFLSMLLDSLAAEDPAELEELLRDNPSLTSCLGGDELLMERVREVLLAEAPAGDAEFGRIVADTRAALAARRDADVLAPAVPLPALHTEQNGILTSVSRKLEPAEALKLYRKIAPLLVFEILKVLDKSASLEVVHRLADHLCSEPIQERLRNSEHAREQIVSELCQLLCDSGIKKALNREALLDILEGCGAMESLNAMDNCIRLSQTKAG